MSAKPEHYDLIRKPIITEKATLASEHGAVVFEVDDGRDQAADQAGGGEAVQRQGEGGQHHHHQGQGEEASAAGPARRRDVKKAYVTLVEGNTIDVSTGL